MKKKLSVESILQTFSGVNVEKEKLYLRRVIGFTSITSSGTTTIALGIAHMLARQGHTVVYIDTAVLFPNAYSYLVSKEDYYSQKGDLLDINEKEYKDIILKTRIENLWLITSRNRTLIDLTSPRDNQDAMKEFINKLKNVYDFVIIDISREPSNVNAASVCACDIIYQVWDEDSTNFLNSKSAVSNLVMMGAEPYKVLRIILNKKSSKIALPSKIFRDNAFKLVTVLPGSYNIKNLCWKRQTVCELISSDQIDIEFMVNFEKVITDMFDLFASANEQDVLKTIESTDDELTEMLSNKDLKTLKKERKLRKKQHKGGAI